MELLQMLKTKERVVVSGGTGVFVSASGKNEESAVLNNDNVIEINGGTGINVQAGTVNNNNNIAINKANNGVVLNER